MGCPQYRPTQMPLLLNMFIVVENTHQAIFNKFHLSRWFCEICRKNCIHRYGCSEKYGAKIVSTEEILSSLAEYKAQHPHLNTKISQIEGWVKEIDKEVLIQARQKYLLKQYITHNLWQQYKNLVPQPESCKLQL